VARIDGRTCTKCDAFKAWSEFNKNSHGKNGHYSNCKDCSRVKANARYAIQDKFQYLKRTYGIEKDTFMFLYAAQDGLCAICAEPMLLGTTLARQACVDHDHDTGKVRGILCNHCNRGIGMFKEDIDSLERAITYLKEHTE
jgi:hypothetical protein